jgi:hypothetical protein
LFATRLLLHLLQLARRMTSGERRTIGRTTGPMTLTMTVTTKRMTAASSRRMTTAKRNQSAHAKSPSSRRIARRKSPLTTNPLMRVMVADGTAREDSARRKEKKLILLMSLLIKNRDVKDREETTLMENRLMEEEHANTRAQEKRPMVAEREHTEMSRDTNQTIAARALKVITMSPPRTLTSPPMEDASHTTSATTEGAVIKSHTDPRNTQENPASTEDLTQTRAAKSNKNHDAPSASGEPVSVSKINLLN